MRYKLYRLTFSTAVHFGKGRLGTCENNFLADRLFSAVCIEAQKSEGNDGIAFFYNAAASGNLLISDSMPYCNRTLYIPKPIVSIERNDSESDSKLKKEFKKLTYIPADSIDMYFKGNLNAQEENMKLSKLGYYSEKTSAAIFENDDALPYNIGFFKFSPECGLYFVIGYENDSIFNKFDSIIYSLGYTGIGGKVTSGFGKFESISEEVPDCLLRRLENKNCKRFISLSVCMAKNEELKNALDSAEYSVIKRSGFVSSVTYSDTFRKKKELYCFSAGSSFNNRFSGEVFDLSDGGSHPVYRYAKPMFMGVNY